MIEPIKATVPKSPVPGMNTKTLGRVKPVTEYKQPVEKVAVEKASVDKTGVEKEAAFVGPVAKGALSAGVVSALKAAGGVAGLAIGTKVVSAVADAVHAPKYKATLEKAVQLNPRLASYPPDRLWDYYQVMISASPNIASNPLIVSNYLEYLIDHEGRLNFTAYDTLSKVEGQGISNRNNAYPLMNSAMKGLIDGAVKYTFDTYKNEKRENEAYAKGKADAYLENQYGLFGQEG